MHDDPVRFADGRTGTYLRVVQADGAPGAAVLPLHHGRVGLVKVYRYPLDSWEWGIPRGFAHGPSPETTAAEEALEELGARPDRIEQIGAVTPDSGLLTSVVHLFAATYTREATSPLDRQEVREVRWVSVGRLLRDAAGQRIRDGFTLSALCCAMSRGLVEVGKDTGIPDRFPEAAGPGQLAPDGLPPSARET